MYFTSAAFRFLEQLADNNDKSWFEAHRSEYQDHVRTPALKYIRAMATRLADFAPEFRADARKMGGSLMRVYRDTCFARDKTPYKINVGSWRPEADLSAERFVAAKPFMRFLCEAAGAR